MGFPFEVDDKMYLLGNIFKFYGWLCCSENSIESARSSSSHSVTIFKWVFHPVDSGVCKSKATSTIPLTWYNENWRGFNWIRVILGNAIKKAEITIDWVSQTDRMKYEEKTFKFISPDDFPHQRPSCGYCSTCSRTSLTSPHHHHPRRSRPLD